MVKRVLITGANKGIGFAISRRCLLDHDDTVVILGSRSIERGEAAIETLAAENAAWRERLVLLELDTASDESVAAAKTTLVKELGGEEQGGLYAICNNAGIAGGELSDIFNVNLRGPRRVDAAFLPLLDQEHGRIVQVSSGAASQCVQKCSDERRAFFGEAGQPHSWASIEGVADEAEALGVAKFGEAGLGAALGGYGLSKALLNCYTIHLAAQHPKLRVNACSPGMIKTDIIDQMVPWFVPSFVVGIIARNVMGALPPDQGTVAPMKLLFGDCASGQYYGSDGLRSPLDRYRSPGTPAYEGPESD